MQTAAEVLLQIAHPISGAAADYDPLLRLVGDAHIVLLGEASHGTHEFYRERAAITKRLIVELGFNALAVEGDWPDAYRVNRFVRGESDDATAEAALIDFKRFPQSGDRTTEPLLLLAHCASIRRRHPLRSDASRRAPGEERGVDRGRGPGDLSDGHLSRARPHPDSDLAKAVAYVLTSASQSA